MCGFTIMVTTSIPQALDTSAGLPGLIVAMLFIALGAGCVKATYFPFLGSFSQRLLS